MNTLNQIVTAGYRRLTESFRAWPRMLAVLLGMVLVPAFAQGAALTPGNVVVVRVGDGAAALAGTGTAVFLEEYTTAGSLVQTIAIPTTTSGANRRLVMTGTTTSEGILTL